LPDLKFWSLGNEQSRDTTGSETNFKEEIQELIEKIFRMVQK